MSMLQQGASMDTLATMLRLSRRELQSLSVKQYNHLHKFVMTQPDDEFMKVAQEYSSDELQRIANDMGLNIGHAVPVDQVDRLMRRVGFTLQGETRNDLIGALQRQGTGVIDKRLFFRLWNFWHTTAKTRRTVKAARVSRLQSAVKDYPDVEAVVRDMGVLARELLQDCFQEDTMGTGALPDDRFLAVLDKRGVRLSRTQYAYLLMLLDHEGFRNGSNVRYEDVFSDLTVSNVASEARVSPQYPAEPMGQELLDEVKRRWSFARSLLPLRIVKEDLVDAFKHIGFSLSPTQSNELWRVLSDVVSLRSNTRTETFLDKSDLDHIFSMQTASERSQIDLAGDRKAASRSSARNQQNTSENIFSFASQASRSPPRPVSAARPQTGRMRSTYDPTDLFGGTPEPPNVFLRVQRQLQQATTYDLQQLRSAFQEYGGIHGIATAAAVCDAFSLIGLFLTSAGADDMIHWVQEHRPLDQQIDPVTFFQVISTSTSDPRILDVLEQPCERTAMPPRPSTGRQTAGDDSNHGIRRVPTRYRQDSSQAMSNLLTRAENHEQPPPPPVRPASDYLHQRHQQQIFPPTQNCDRTYALQHLQLERPLLAMLMRGAQHYSTKLDRHALLDVLLHPRLQLTTHMPEAEIPQLVDDIISYTNSQSRFEENRVDFSNVMTYISNCLNQNGGDQPAEAPAAADQHFRSIILQKLCDSSIIQGNSDRLLGMHSRLLQRLVDLRSKGNRGVERELQGAELLTVSTVMECLYAIDMSLTREEATWLWTQATHFDSSEPSRARQPLSTHEQSQAVTLSSVITVLLTILTEPSSL